MLGWLVWGAFGASIYAKAFLAEQGQVLGHLRQGRCKELTERRTDVPMLLSDQPQPEGAVDQHRDCLEDVEEGKAGLNHFIRCRRGGAIFLYREAAGCQAYICGGLRSDRQAHHEREDGISHCGQVHRPVGGDEESVSESDEPREHLLAYRLECFGT